MKKMFQDTKPGQVLTAFIDIIWAGVLWLLLCVPVITGGASCCALYYVVVKCTRHERGHITREFFSAFKTNFRLSTPVWLVLLALIAVSLLKLRLAMLYLIPLLVVVPWLFPYISRFSQPLLVTVRNAAVLSVRNIGKSLLLALVLIVWLLISYLLPIVIPLLPGFAFLLFSFEIEPVFKEITLQMENDENEDKWYNE